MIPSLTAQQIAFFAKNGFLELEGLLDERERQELLKTMDGVVGSGDWISGRDLWQKSPEIKQLLTSRKLSSFPLQLTGRASLQLAFDQWIAPPFSLKAPTKMKDLFSVQGLACILFLRLTEEPFTPPKKRSPLGLFPFPTSPGNILFVDPSLLISWPPSSVALYLVAYALPSSAVYVQNLKDPAGGSLRKLGYEFGDRLRDRTHPLIQKRG